MDLVKMQETLKQEIKMKTEQLAAIDILLKHDIPKNDGKEATCKRPPRPDSKQAQIFSAASSLNGDAFTPKQVARAAFGSRGKLRSKDMSSVYTALYKGAEEGRFQKVSSRPLTFANNH